MNIMHRTGPYVSSYNMVMNQDTGVVIDYPSILINVENSMPNCVKYGSLGEITEEYRLVSEKLKRLNCLQNMCFYYCIKLYDYGMAADDVCTVFNMMASHVNTGNLLYAFFTNNRMAISDIIIEAQSLGY